MTAGINSKSTARFIILMYHMISDSRSQRERRFACPPLLFEKHMDFLIMKGYNFIGLDMAVSYLKQNNGIPAGSVVITFDDGFEDNYTNAFPVLQKRGLPATIFLTAGMLGKSNKWMEARGFPSKKMLNWAHVRDMHASGIIFGAHTMTHPRLTEMSFAEAVKEIDESKRIIEDKLGSAVDYFAYPFGLFSNEIKEIVEDAGYCAACSTRSGFNEKGTDPYILKRVEIRGSDSLRQLSQKLRFGTNEASILLPLRYYYGRVMEMFWR